MNVNKENLNKKKQVQNVDYKIPDKHAILFSSNCVVVQKNIQANFEANFGYMLVDVLRFLYYKLKISEAGSKQDLINHLVSKNKKREVSEKANIEKKNVSFASKNATAAMLPCPFVQPMWHQSPFQLVGSDSVSFEGQ
ncbi:21339_t:CDS:2 [Cetraspora pellucida]|uniref:21339_t:CDS:1 n=1 Tax=Cetraspora pellucida TaxID=1433469 RepID=A0A9N9HK57_9GLOM|nr:21339_t:CDS:2 [Cetraspora pellucida]